MAHIMGLEIFLDKFLDGSSLIYKRRKFQRDRGISYFLGLPLLSLALQYSTFYSLSSQIGHLV
jgi:hypothetical protein